MKQEQLNKFKPLQCDYCDKPLVAQEEQSFVRVGLDFEGYMIDGITGIPMRVDPVSRNTEAYMCNDCFLGFVDAMEKYLENFNTKVANIGQPFVHGEQGLSPDKVAEPKRAAENFNAAKGTVPRKESRMAPPVNDQVKPLEVVNV